MYILKNSVICDTVSFVTWCHLFHGANGRTGQGVKTITGLVMISKLISFFASVFLFQSYVFHVYTPTDVKNKINFEIIILR